MLLLRLSPLIPFNALDYISGVTSISLRDYSLALCGILPGTIMSVTLLKNAAMLPKKFRILISEEFSCLFLSAMYYVMLCRFCMVGATASSLTDAGSSSENRVVHIISLTGGVIFAILGVSVASYYSKVELDKVGVYYIRFVFH